MADTRNITADPQKLPLGIQTFSKIREKGYVYVDKTDYVAKLVRTDQYYFLSRPRRFGKSLLLSTIRCYFEGKRDLFKGLAIEKSDVDWEPAPVLYFDFNNGNYSEPDGLENQLRYQLADYEAMYGIEPNADDISRRFSRLIRTVKEQTGRAVAILVDEYDKPLLAHEEGSDAYNSAQNLMKVFFSNLKTMDEYIRFALISGIARFSKVSIFSDVNNLRDISMSDEFAAICGWTESELTTDFETSLRSLSDKMGSDRSETAKALRSYYDGYLFTDKGDRLYNPFSVLTSLAEQKIEPYWFETGTPTFLAKRVRKSGINISRINDLSIGREELLSVGVMTDNPISLMFQTGYLTIAHRDAESGRYSLRFPNREVEIGFSQVLLPFYISEASLQGNEFYFGRFADDIFQGNPDRFMKRLQALFAGEAYRRHSEAEYQSQMFLLFNLAGARAEMERHTSNGRTDIEIRTSRFIYIFELKYNKHLKDAVSQLREKGYADRYALDSRKKFLIGINIVDSKGFHGIESYQIESI